MTENNHLIVPQPDALALAGEIANRAAAESVFEDYRQRKASQTLRRQDADLALFAQFLAQTAIVVSDLGADPVAWRGVSWGIVSAFVQWQLQEGYAVGSVNVRLATIKAYCALAHQAGEISGEAYTQIKTVKGYGNKQARKVDEKRGITRVGDKKASAVSLTKEQADQLKGQPNTAQGRRDALLMCLLLDHGLRCGEVAGLRVEDFDLKTGVFTFFRPKVDKIQTHKMTADTLRAATAYLNQDAEQSGLLLKGSRRGGHLSGQLSVRAINDRIRVLGQRIDVDGLSPHDCRHYWATRAARQGTDPFALQEAGGWNSLAMPRRYVENATIANEGVKL